MTLARGSPTTSYKLLPTYLKMVEKKNVGSRTFIESDDSNHFKYIFMAIGSYLREFS